MSCRMEVTSHCHRSDITECRTNKKPNQSECSSSQLTANGTLLRHQTDEASPELSDRSEDGRDSLTGGSSTNHVSRLPPSPAAVGQNQIGVGGSSPPPVCSPPAPSVASPPLPRSSTCNRHSRDLRHHHRLSSTKSHASLKTDAAHIKEVAGDDCCVHCLLACLFCELLSMCSAVGECLACGVGGAGCCDAAVGCCCCVEAACAEEACQAAVDCGVMEDCCGSSDCLEICLECCSICFPA